VTDRTSLFYTFGNHMHWVDMEWLWGYHVLPGSVRDMLAFSQATGAKGNVNFDGVGYERLATEDPEAFNDLRNAIRKGDIEIVGGSYGQPYGGLHGGESNIRQRVYGVRTALRLFGVRPKTFWEEEFDFFPQLPQMLAGAGFDGASLFFQWTWHTPELPFEESPIVLWESPDGSRIRSATRNRLNLHQWPEDIDALLNTLEPTTDSAGTPLILQWLELMPSPDWMCRSEILLPKTKELLSDPRFSYRFGTLGDYLRSEAEKQAPVRRYGPDDVFHGISLGKNGDLFRRLSHRAERSLLSAETWAAVAGLFGRPYAQWDVYPTWELEEAWRELLQAQHHDNDECEGLCGHVGRFSYERSLSLSGHIHERTLSHLVKRIDAPEGSLIAFNSLGWNVDTSVTDPETGVTSVLRDIPSMGWRSFAASEAESFTATWSMSTAGATGRSGSVEVTVDSNGHLVQIRTLQCPEGMLDSRTPLLQFTVTENGQIEVFKLESMEMDPLTSALVLRFHHPRQGGIRADIRIVPEMEAIDITLSAGHLSRPDGGMNAGIQTSFGIAGGLTNLTTDSPYAVHQVRANGSYKRKYPTGDWMTSDQWFEDIVHPFHSLSMVDLTDDEGAGLLVLHDGSQQWFRDETQIRNLLTMYDPWDEEYWIDRFHICYRLIPHAGLSNQERWKYAQTFLRPPEVRAKGNVAGGIPASFSGVAFSNEDALVTALYRETLESGKGLPDYAGNDIKVDYGYVLRFVEFNGNTAEAPLILGATAGAMFETNLVGEVRSPLAPTERISVNPFGIKTVMLDLLEGRKLTRDLDARREAWATVHRID